MVRSLRRLTGPIGFGLAILFAAGALRAAPQTRLPTGREIVTRYVAAIGGEDAFKAIRSVVARGRWEIPAQRLSGTFELRLARPSFLLYRVSVAELGRVELGFDGRVGWTVSPLAGPELLTGKQLSEAADDAWFDNGLYPPDRVRELTTVGTEMFDGREAYRVKVVLTSGNEQFDFFDKSSSLRIGTEATRSTSAGSIPTVNILRDYKLFGSLRQPTVRVERALGFETVVTTTSWEYVEQPDGTFDLPPDVKALITR
jgi:hypothetical protein